MKYSTVGMGSRIKQERLSLGFTQSELAAAINVTKGAVSAWESGNTKNLRVSHLFAVADYLKVKARWLAFGSQPYSTWE